MKTSENHENVKRKVMAKGYCQPRKNKMEGNGNKHK
jgi:hypothetical protein